MRRISPMNRPPARPKATRHMLNHTVPMPSIPIGTLLNAFTIMDVNSEVQNIIKGVVLLVAIVLDNFLHPRDEETARQGD